MRSIKVEEDSLQTVTQKEANAKHTTSAVSQTRQRICQSLSLLFPPVSFNPTNLYYDYAIVSSVMLISMDQ